MVSVLMTLLMIEFLDELVFGAKEAAWPLIRNDLFLDYLQVGLLLSMPNLASTLIEPLIGILGDTWRRRVLVLVGGVVFILALVLTGSSQSFWALLISFVLFYPASGAFVSLSQAALMDSQPERHEQNMARWTFAGSLGVVFGPLLLGGAGALGASWRVLFLVFGGLAFVIWLGVWRVPFPNERGALPIPDPSAPIWEGLRLGAREAWVALQRKEVLRWLILLEFADLVLDIFYGYLALYFVDVAGVAPEMAGFAVAIWTGTGLLGDFLLIPLLEKVRGLDYLRVSALLVLVIFPVFLMVPGITAKLVLAGILGFLNAGWYAIPKGQLYSVMPNRSGTVMAIGNVFHFLGGLIPLGIGMAAQKFGLQAAMWSIMLGPIAMIIGLRGNRRGSIKPT